MKEHSFPYESFIGGWYIDPEICDQVINFFEDNKQHQHSGVSSKDGEVGINKEVKDSIDITVNHKTNIGNYGEALQKVLDNYIEKYPEIDTLNSFKILENYVIQYYKRGGGYKKNHFERDGLRTSWRTLVFMTYLNDVDDGGTHFKYQKLTAPAKKGLTLIWPSDWTHTHKGQISNTKEKYIITGWYNYEQ